MTANLFQFTPTTEPASAEINTMMVDVPQPQDIPDGIYDNLMTGRREKWRDGTVVRQVSFGYLNNTFMHRIGHLEMRGEWKSKPQISIVPNIIIKACHGEKSKHVTEDMLPFILGEKKRKKITIKAPETKK